MEPTGGVDDDGVDASGLRGLHRVEDDAGRVPTGLTAGDVDTDAFAPVGELLGGGGPERVGGDEEDPVPGVDFALGELGRGGGLPDAVHADEQPHVGVAGLVAQRAVGVVAELVGDLGLEQRRELVGVADPGAPRLGAKRIEQPAGGGHPDVGEEEGLFEVVPGLVVETTGPPPIAETAEGGAAASEPLTEYPRGGVGWEHSSVGAGGGRARGLGRRARLRVFASVAAFASAEDTRQRDEQGGESEDDHEDEQNGRAGHQRGDATRRRSPRFRRTGSPVRVRRGS